jgi:hypothetical protein
MKIYWQKQSKILKICYPKCSSPLATKEIMRIIIMIKAITIRIMKKMHTYNIYRINYNNKINKMFCKIIICLISSNKNNSSSMIKRQLLIRAKIFPKFQMINNNNSKKLIMKCTCQLQLINIKVMEIADFKKIKYI